MPWLQFSAALTGSSLQPALERTHQRSASGFVRHACWLGVELDEAANANRGPKISTARSKVSVWVVPTNEELMIARHTGSLLGLAKAAQ